MNETAKRHWLRVMVAAFCAVFVSAAIPVSAQDDNTSHRRLELPQGGSTDFRMQMQMMSQLQKLLGQQQANETTPGPSVSPEQMSMLKQMMENFSGQVPEDLMKQVGNLPPEVISQIGQQIQNNPAARQQAMEMLKQFMQNRQLPQGGGGGGTPMLPPELGGNSNNQNGPDNRQPSGQRRPGRSSEDAADDSASDNGGFSFKDFSVDKMMEKMREMERKARGGSDNSETPKSGSPSDDSNVQIRSRNDRNRGENDDWDPLAPDRKANPPTETAESSQGPNRRMTIDEGMSRIDEILRQREQRNQPESNGQRPPSDAIGNASPPLQTTPNSPAAGNDERPVRSMFDFLKRFVPEEGANNLPGKAEGTGIADGIDAPNEDPEGRSVEEIRQEQEEVKREVAQRGFAKTLKRIVRDAFNQAKSEGPGASATKGNSESGAAEKGMSDSMVEAVTGIVKDVREILSEEGVTFPQSSAKPDSGGASSRRDTSSDDWLFGGITESAGELFEDLSSVATVPDVVSAPETEGLNADALIPVFVFGLLAAVAFALAWRSGLITVPGADAASSGVVLTPGGIRTKSDVVKAFHQMALTPERASDDWWTHQKVVDTLIEQEPHKSESAETLGRLYEVARYLPDDYEFTREELENARLAIAEYRS